MSKEGRFAILGLWSVVKTIIVCLVLAYFSGSRWSEIMAAVAMWHIWADRIMKEESKAAQSAQSNGGGGR